MTATESMPVECRGVDVEDILGRLPGGMAELFFTTGEQRLQRLNEAMDRGDANAVMDAAHALASLTGLLHIRALSDYARDIYGAAQRGELESARYPHERLTAILGWTFARVRPHGARAGA